MTIDPAYRIAPAEWPAVVAKGPIWRWVGDGVVASLTVNNFPGVDGKPAYDMDLEFQLLASKRRIDAENLARRLKEGDAKGWHSTAKHEAEKKERAALNKRLEANALARGDSVVSRP